MMKIYIRKREEKIMRKRLLYVMLAFVLVSVLTLAGCGESETESLSDVLALDALETVWNSYGEDERFPVSGGDIDNTVMDAPGKFSVASGDAVDASLGYPADKIGDIDDAASLIHMMNANTVTAAAFRLSEGTDAKDAAKAIEDNLDGRQWMCGFPDKLAIVKVGQRTIISVFGNEELVDTFIEKAQVSYEKAEILTDKSLSF